VEHASLSSVNYLADREAAQSPLWNYPSQKVIFEFAAIDSPEAVDATGGVNNQAHGKERLPGLMSREEAKVPK